MSERFSSGEWEAEDDGDGYLINGIIRVPHTYEEHHDDARLIVAAPDLYRAASKALHQLDYIRNLNGDEGIMRSVADTLRKALAKAIRPTDEDDE